MGSEMCIRDRVKSNVVSTVKHPAYSGYKLLVVRKVHPISRQEYGDSTIAIDFVDAGEGDIVLVSEEGGSARRIVDNMDAPIRSFILGIVENWSIDEEE